MATLYVTVFPDAARTALGDIEQALSVANLSGSNQQSSAVTENTSKTRIKTVRLYADANCWVAYGASPDATGTERMPLGADAPEYLTVPVGTKFAAITRA